MTESSEKTGTDSAEASEISGLSSSSKGSPVAVGFAATKDDIPADVPEIEKRFKHCQMVSLARNEGRVFYSTAEDHECMGGAYALGLKELTPTLKSGKFYHKLGKFESISPRASGRWGACPTSPPGRPSRPCMPRWRRPRLPRR